MIVGRRNLLLSAAALALVAACNGAGGGTAITEDDVAIGSETATVTLIEYASTTCPHCAEFHNEAWEQLKANYIDNGRVRFVFREFPTDPAAVAVAGFQLARCGNADPNTYFARISELFRQQRAMFATGSIEGIRDAMIDIGTASGLSREQITQCFNDPAGGERIRRIGEASRPLNVTGTPTLFINGRRYEGQLTYAALSGALDAALAG